MGQCLSLTWAHKEDSRDQAGARRYPSQNAKEQDSEARLAEEDRAHTFSSESTSSLMDVDLSDSGASDGEDSVATVSSKTNKVASRKQQELQDHGNQAIMDIVATPTKHAAAALEERHQEAPQSPDEKAEAFKGRLALMRKFYSWEQISLDFFVDVHVVEDSKYSVRRSKRMQRAASCNPRSSPESPPFAQPA